MGLFIFERHLIWSGPNAEGGITFYYYYDAITWIVGGLAITGLLVAAVGRRGLVWAWLGLFGVAGLVGMIELWVGIECTVNRVGATYHDQIERSGHALRVD